MNTPPASLVLIAALLLFTGCTDTPPPSAASPALAEPSRVTLYHYWDDSFPRLRDTIAAEADALNAAQDETRVWVDAVTHEAFKANAKTMLRDASSAELYSWWGGGRTQALIDDDLVTPLDSWWKQSSSADAFTPAMITAGCRYGDHFYLVPLIQGYVGIFYNRAVFDRYGVALPRDWDGFRTACVQLRAAGINPIALGGQDAWPAQFWFDYLLLRSAGSAYRQRLIAGEAAFTDPEVRQAFTLWRELIDLGAFNPKPTALDWKDAAKLVHARGAAMTLMGSWIMDPWTELGWQPGTDYGYISFPSLPGSDNATSLTVIDGLVLANSDLPPQAAFPLLDHLIQPAVQARIAEASGSFSPHRAVSPSPEQIVHRQILDAIGDNELAFAWDLSTKPAAEKAGLDLFHAFLEDPDRIDELLIAAQAAIDRGE
ncbi:MAG: ABC transporter substrate-binding protein [Planctomycetota bacterium]|jgi:ABC-type glycerol-3-phosphate transport system substrate-binding protein|nr:ABC transporter substrate-binding protein [Planctomycetota bacterium]